MSEPMGETATGAADYSLANARNFGWGSVSGRVVPDRARALEKYVVGASVLDAGCGGGAYVDLLAGRGLAATGVDKFDMFLDLAAENKYRGTFVKADLTALPFPDKSFDTTYCFDVLEHVDDAAAVRELARVTRRRLVVTVPQQDDRPDRYMLTYIPYMDGTHLRYYTPDRLRALLGAVAARVEVSPEARVPLEWLVRNEFAVRSRVPLLSGLYRRAFRFLAGRATGPDWHVNLMGVADLAPAPGAA